MASGAVKALPLYTTDGLEFAVDLSDNTNLWGAPPAALRSPSNGSISIFLHRVCSERTFRVCSQ